ncbi:hypothetical protein SFC02_05955 [Terribacillus goriensis]|uniref:hypothetical protein n=1 Tax=Terribacillus saccharophilus TaxID=361277 RepID=UPI003982DA28
MKELDWFLIEEKINEFKGAPTVERADTIFQDIFYILESYLNKKSISAYQRAKRLFVSLPLEDFSSNFHLALWNVVQEDDSHEQFKIKLLHRLKIAEASVWRKYKTKGSQDDKDETSYNKARWETLSFDKEEYVYDQEVSPSTEEVFMEAYTLKKYINDFIDLHPNSGRIIKALYLGYYGKELANTIYGEPYTTTIRKKVERARDEFKKFLFSTKI